MVTTRADMVEAEIAAYQQMVAAQLESSQALIPLLRDAVRRCSPSDSGS